MWNIRRADERFRSDQPGITTWHSFSSGAHYDAANVSFGPVLACDEHHLEPGAGFETHAHARVELLSWVLEGTLLHEDDTGRSRTVAAGQAQYQLAGHGITHAERNASDSEPLHFIQFWLLTEDEIPDYQVTTAPVDLSVGKFLVLDECDDYLIADAPSVHLFVAAGRYQIGGKWYLPGDSLRVEANAFEIGGDGQLLVLDLDLDPYGRRWR